jgi:hypothetical protein
VSGERSMPPWFRRVYAEAKAARPEPYVPPVLVEQEVPDVVAR